LVAKEWMDEFDNLFVLENDVNYVDGVAIIGATLWTDFDKENPILMNQVCDEYMGMNDYKQIRKGQVTVDPWNPDGVMSYGKISPAFLLHKHYVSRDYIFKQIAKEKKQGRKVIVMSHYGPTWMSIDKQYIGDSFNGAYVSDLSNEILDTEPDIWVHGHVHQSFDYMVGDCTRVICNPRGYYPTELNKNFNPTFSFELSGND
jgi:predicted phosphohydrolase